MEYLFEYVISSLATLAFSYYFNCPRRSMPYTTLLGGMSWTIYSIMLNNNFSYIVSASSSAFIVAMFSEYLARKLKIPATIFLLPAIVPLVPGAGMYYTMYNLIEQNYVVFEEKAIETLFMAGSLAVGVVASSSIFKVISYYRYKNNKFKK